MQRFITQFYGDPHFGHAKIIGHVGRPFADVAAMDRHLEEQYTRNVGWFDTVAWLGDVSFAEPEWTQALLKRLPGRKVLVRGNHDGTITRCLKLGFDAVFDALHLLIADHKVTACHYPPWNGPATKVLHPERRPFKPGPGEFILHGHTHEKERRIGRRIHVGVDAWDYRPATWQEVAALIEEKP